MRNILLLTLFITTNVSAVVGVTTTAPAGTSTGSTASTSRTISPIPTSTSTTTVTPATFAELIAAQEERENTQTWTGTTGSISRSELLAIMNSVRNNAPVALRDYINMVLTFAANDDERLGALLSMMSMDPAFFKALEAYYQSPTANELYPDSNLATLIAREMGDINSPYKGTAFPILVLEPTAGSLAVNPTCFTFKTTSAGVTAPSISKRTSQARRSCERQYTDLNSLTLTSYFKRFLDPDSLSQGDLQSAFSSLALKKELNDRVMGYGLVYYWHNRTIGNEVNPLFEGVERLKDIIAEATYEIIEQHGASAGIHNAPTQNETFNEAVANQVNSAETNQGSLSSYLNSLQGTNP